MAKVLAARDEASTASVEFVVDGLMDTLDRVRALADKAERLKSKPGEARAHLLTQSKLLAEVRQTLDSMGRMLKDAQSAVNIDARRQTVINVESEIDIARMSAEHLGQYRELLRLYRKRPVEALPE